MANKLFFLVSLQFVCGILCQEAGNNYLSYPVDCVGDEVYPWFDGCNKYLQCNNAGKAALIDCPQNPPDNLQIVCSENNSSCGYSACTVNTTDIVGLSHPNASYYAMCIKSVIVYQSKCRSNNSALTPKFDSVTKQCTGICEDGSIIRSPDCRSYQECVSDNLIMHPCPPGSLFDGQRCSFSKQTC